MYVSQPMSHISESLGAFTNYADSQTSPRFTELF